MAHERIQMVHLDLIRSTKLNPRKRFDSRALKELADSIEELGVLQPVLLRPIDDGLLEIVAGERRVRAAEMAQLGSIPAMIIEMDAEEAASARLCENLQREDLDPLEEAEGLRELHKVFKLSAFEIGEKIGKSKAYVYARLKLLELPSAILAAMAGDPPLNASVALLLARWPQRIAEAALPSMFANHPVGKMSLSVRQAKKLLTEQFCRRLSDATWDLETTSRGGSGLLPACRSCPKRCGNEPELFEGILAAEAEKVSADVCTDPDCFVEKLAGAGAAILEEAKKEGSAVMTMAAAKKAIFPYGHTHLPNGYIDLDEKCYEKTELGSKAGKWKTAIAGRKKIPAEEITVAIDPHGQVRRLMKRAAAVKLAVKFEQPWASKRSAGGPDTDYAAAERKKAARRKKAFKVRELIVEMAIPHLAERAEVFWSLDITRLVAAMLWESVPSQTRKSIGERRGWPVMKGQSAWMGPLIPAKLGTKDLRGIALEVLACGGAGHEYDTKLKKRIVEISAAMGIDLAALRKEAMAELRPKKATKAKRASKGGGDRG